MKWYYQIRNTIMQYKRNEKPFYSIMNKTFIYNSQVVGRIVILAISLTDSQSENYLPQAILEQLVEHRFLLEETEWASSSRSQIDEFARPKEIYQTLTCTKIEQYELLVISNIMQTDHETILTSYENTSVKFSNSKVSWGTLTTSAKILWQLGRASRKGDKSLCAIPTCSFLATTLFLLSSHSRIIVDLMLESHCDDTNFFLFTLCCCREV